MLTSRLLRILDILAAAVALAVAALYLFVRANERPEGGRREIAGVCTVENGLVDPSGRRADVDGHVPRTATAYGIEILLPDGVVASCRSWSRSEAASPRVRPRRGMSTGTVDRGGQTHGKLPYAGGARVV